MVASLPPVAVAFACCVLLALGLVAFEHAFAAPDEHGPSASTPSALAGLSPTRAVGALVVAFAVLLLSGWPVLALAAGALTLLWGRILHDRRADEERRRIEGIAKWLEDLRDTLRGSAVGAEEALEQVAMRPPPALEVPMRHYVHRRRQGFRTEEALADLADELAHPTADAAVAAITLVVSGTSGAGRLHATVQALAAAARDEVTARERVDRTRAVYEQSMQRLVVIAVLLVAYLRVAGGDLLDPYGTPVGQVVLLVPLSLWAGCIAWLRSLCRYELPARRRSAGVTA